MPTTTPTKCPHGVVRGSGASLSACNCCLRNVPLAAGDIVCPTCRPTRLDNLLADLRMKLEAVR